MKRTYLNNFKEKTKDELLYIIHNAAKYNKDAIAAAHELLRKKTATFSEYQALTSGKTDFEETRKDSDNDASIGLTVLKWIGIVLFFPLSLVVIGYYKNKKAKKEYYANNRPYSER